MSDDHARPVVKVPTSDWQPGGPARLALLEGTVQVEALGPDDWRVWVERDSGEAVPVGWPAGFSARLDPFELLDGTGTVVAGAGTAISVCGGLMALEPRNATKPGLAGALCLVV